MPAAPGKAWRYNSGSPGLEPGTRTRPPPGRQPGGGRTGTMPVMWLVAFRWSRNGGVTIPTMGCYLPRATTATQTGHCGQAAR